MHRITVMIMQWFSLKAPQQPKKLTPRQTMPMTMMKMAARFTVAPKNARYSLKAVCSTAPPMMNTSPTICEHTRITNYRHGIFKISRLLLEISIIYDKLLR